jgi:hypothetical protein
VNLRDSNERLLAENKKLIDTIKDHEVKEKNEELKGQEQLLEILKNQTPSSSGRTSGRKGAKDITNEKVDENAELEQQDSQTPESSDEGSREKTVIMADDLRDQEVLKVPEAAQNVDEPKEEDGDPDSERSSQPISESNSDHQSNIKGDTDQGVSSANVAIATNQFESGIASHEGAKDETNNRET